MYKTCKLSKSLSTLNSLHFPYKIKKYTSKRYTTTIGIGGNLGDVKRRFEHLFNFFKRDKRVEIQQTSLILKNPPFGFTEQDDFFNSIMILSVDMQPKAFLAYLMRVEKKFARTRSFANAPRTLDLDIIFFDNRSIKTSKLTVPHIDWASRESVLIPLMGLHK